MGNRVELAGREPSPPAQGAWIEIYGLFCNQLLRIPVAPCTGGVD